MLDSIFQNLFETGNTSSISLSQFLLCLGTSLALGAFLAFIYIHKTRYTQSFVLTLAFIPAIVCIVILLVNGSVGAGVAAAGAFNLVRFRSVPGSAKEIGAIFSAMGAGLAVGMGYLGYGVIFTLALGLLHLLCIHLGLGISRQAAHCKILHITVPEHLNYTQVFQEPLDRYTSNYEMTQVKTTNMGSLYKLTYSVTLKDPSLEQELIDELRCRNGNLEISLACQETLACETL